MRFTITSFCLIFLTFFASHSVEAQMQSLPSSSPRAAFSQQFALTTVKVSYGRPGVKGREIFGNLVPFNKIWRAGANAPTTFSVDDDITINGEALKKGEYVVLVQPSADSWDIIFNSNPKTSYSNYLSDDNELVLSVSTQRTADLVETFTISTSDIKDSRMKMTMAWENTQVTLDLYNEVDKEMKAEFAQKLAGPTSSDYFGYARYLYNSDQKMEEALTYISRSVDMNKGYGNLRYKGLILAKLGRYKEAIDWLTQSRDRAATYRNDDYVRINEASIAEVKKMMK
ncbi:MAG: DUF2911 domain-containing protein [Bacteroidota bacterium]